MVPIYIKAVSYLGTLVIMARLGRLLLPIWEPLVVLALLSSTLGGRCIVTLSFAGGLAKSLGSFVAFFAYVVVLHGLVHK